MIELCILLLLREREMYGYEISKRLRSLGEVLSVEEGTLYPLLRRLEQRNYLISEWKIVGGRVRRYYRLSEKGARALSEMLRFWRSLVSAVESLAEGGEA